MTPDDANRIPYVKEYRDRHGRVRRYFRRSGREPIPLAGVPGTSQFAAAYDAAMEAKPSPAARHGHGTFGALIASYFGSVEFTNLKPSSRTAYHYALDPIAKEHGHRLVRDMPRDKARKIIEAIGATRPGMANLVTAAFKRVMQYAIETGWRNDNPLSGIRRYKLGSHHTWTDAELAAYEKRWPLGTRERLAYALLLYSNQRGGDVVRMRRSDISGGAIHVVQQKTGTELLIPIHPALAEALKAGPANGIYLIGDSYGRPIQRRTLTGLVKQAVKAAGLPRHCVPHGLRKALLRRLAEDGATSKQIAAISGHRSLKEVERYTAAADQKELAHSAIIKLRDRTK